MRSETNKSEGATGDQIHKPAITASEWLSFQSPGGRGSYKQTKETRCGLSRPREDGELETNSKGEAASDNDQGWAHQRTGLAECQDGGRRSSAKKVGDEPEEEGTVKIY